MRMIKKNPFIRKT